MTRDARQGWDGITDAIAQTRREIAAIAPTADIEAEGQAYLARLLAGAIEAALLRDERSEGGLFVAGPQIAGANPDYRMLHAHLSSGQSYRLEGEMGDADRIAIGLYSPLPDFGLDLDDHIAISRDEVTTDNRFSVHITPAPRLSPRDLAMSPTATLLRVRELHRVPGRPACYRLIGPGGPRPPVAPSIEAVDRQLGRIGKRTTDIFRQFALWSQAFARIVNRVEPLSAELDAMVRGDPDARYFVGSFNIGDDDVLEISMPDLTAEYWNLHILNYWLEPIAFANINDRTAVRDPDGIVRLHIGSGKRRMPNWLDSAGRRRGSIMYRIVGAQSAPLPVFRLLNLPKKY